MRISLDKSGSSSSPLEPGTAGMVNLSGSPEEIVRQILAAPMDYVEDASFAKPNAYRKLFEEAPAIPRPNTCWYHPVIEEAGTTRNIKGVVNVVLDSRQEQALFLQFNYARHSVAQLQRKIGSGAPGRKQSRELLRWYRLVLQLRDQIAQSNLALVLAMAKRVRHSEMDFSDLISEGNMALLRAIDKFDVSRGFKFSTYACRAILKAFSRSGMKNSLYRQLFPTDFDPMMERSDYQRRRYDEHEEGCADEVMRIVIDNRAKLTDIEREVIQRRFAIREKRKAEESAVPLTLEQVGQIIGLTKERVRQIQNRALDKIRQTLEAGYLDGPKNQGGA